MKNFALILEVDAMIHNYSELSNRLFHRLSESAFNAEYGDWDSGTYRGLSNVMFFLITGESNFYTFYDRFGSPGKSDNKPIGWGDSGFIPDRISDAMFDTDTSTKEKIKSIKSLYRQARKVEREFAKVQKRKKTYGR